MEIEYRPCKQEHLKLIHPQDGEQYNQLVYTSPYFKELLESEFSLSAWAGSRCIGAGGIMQIYPGRSVAWAYIGRDAGRYFTPLVRKMRKVLETFPCRRIEITVIMDFEPGHRLAKLLGFECETPNGMRKYGVNGTDETLYARVK